MTNHIALVATLTVMSIAPAAGAQEHKTPDPSTLAAAARLRESNRNFPVDWWKDIKTRDAAWYRSPEARRMTANILSWQAANGGWPLMNTTREPWTGDPGAIGPWGRDGALIGGTVNEMRFLARAYRATGDVADKKAIVRALDFILDAQYPSGGWPKSYPNLVEPYFRFASLNDDEMTDLMALLRDAAASPDFALLDAARRAKAQAAFDRGVGFLIRSQVRISGQLTAWAQQYDPVTLKPMPARTFEPAAVSGEESAGVVKLLMAIDHPSPQIRRAVEAAVAWYRRAAIKGIRMVYADHDRVVARDASAPPIWARYYNLETGRPEFMGRDGVPRTRLADIEKERRGGYAWYGYWGQPVLDAYPAWRTRVGSGR